MNTQSKFLPAFASLLLIAACERSAMTEVHTFTSDAAGFSTHSFWIDDGQEVTVVDAQFTAAYAEALVAEIRAHTPSPITRVIVTHPNPDKFNGLSVFHRLGAESITSEQTANAMSGVDAYKRAFWIDIAKAFTADSYPVFEPVTTTFSGSMTIPLHSSSITLFALAEPGVSSSQTVVRVDDTGDLIVGDLVHHETHAWLEGGIVDGAPSPTLDGWRRDLRALLLLGEGVVYGGRGTFVPVDEAVDAQLEYLDRAEVIVTAYVEGLGVDAADELGGADAGAHWAAIQAELEHTFPGYAQPELIGYGVYGLALSKLPTTLRR